MSGIRAIRCVVAGRVQGVFYRASTATEAQRLGIDGSVRNLPDGRVEVVAKGEGETLADLVAWLWRGPPTARVQAVYVEEWFEPVPPGFVVER